CVKETAGEGPSASSEASERRGKKADISCCQEAMDGRETERHQCRDGAAVEEDRVKRFAFLREWTPRCLSLQVRAGCCARHRGRLRGGHSQSRRMHSATEW